MKYYVNKDCIGCGLCASMCPEVFHMTDEGRAQADDEPVPDEIEAAAREAKENCPVSAVEEEK